MDNTKNLGNNNQNNNRPFKTHWLIWVYLIIFYTYSSFIYMGEQRAAQEEQKKQEQIQEIIEFETTEFKLNLKEVEDNKEVWKTYIVNVIDGRESNGVYWLDNSKTEGYIIKLRFEEDGSVIIEEWTQDKIKARHLARLSAGSINIKTYDEIKVEQGGDEVEQKETKKTNKSTENKE